MNSIDLTKSKSVPFVAVCSFMRSGTHATIDTIRNNFPQYDLRRKLFQSLDSHYIAIDTLLEGYKCKRSVKSREWLKLKNATNGILKTHFAKPQFRDLFDQNPLIYNVLKGKYKSIYVVRDPAKVLTSLYCIESSYLELPLFRDWLPKKINSWNNHVHQHTAQNDSLVIRFEDLLKEPEKAVSKIARYLNSEYTKKERYLAQKSKSRVHQWLARLHLLNYESTEISPKFNSIRIDESMVQYAHNLIKISQPTEALKFGYLEADKH